MDKFLNTIGVAAQASAPYAAVATFVMWAAIIIAAVGAGALAITLYNRQVRKADEDVNYVVIISMTVPAE